MMAAEKHGLKVVRSATPPEKGVFDSLIEKISLPSLDPRDWLRDHLPLPDPLCEFLSKHCEPDFELVEETTVDLFAPTERKYTLARAEAFSFALLTIPQWIVGNGHVVGAVQEICSAFEGQVVRVVSPNCDTPSLALKKMFDDWKARYRIDARFISWGTVRQLDEGYSLVDVFELQEYWPPKPGPDPVPPVPVERTRVFISYSHKDADWLERLQVQLKPLLRQLREERPEVADELLVWEDTRIEPGGEWRQEIDGALATARVAVLLVSKHFLASDFIAENELPPILTAAAKEGQRVLWVLLDACNWEATKIKDFDAAVKPLVRLDSLEVDDQDESLKAFSQLIVKYLTE